MANFIKFVEDGEKDVEKNPQPEETIVEDVNAQLVKMLEEDEPKSTDVADDCPSVLNLRNLYRQSKINKSQYIGGLATLVATGLISKSEFTRLKTSA